MAESQSPDKETAMSDNAKRFCIIRKELTKLFPSLQGNAGRHLNTLAAFVSGIIGAKNVHLPEVANKVPDGTKLTSREKKLSGGSGMNELKSQNFSCHSLNC